MPKASMFENEMFENKSVPQKDPGACLVDDPEKLSILKMLERGGVCTVKAMIARLSQPKIVSVDRVKRHFELLKHLLWSEVFLLGWLSLWKSDIKKNLRMLEECVCAISRNEGNLNKTKQEWEASNFNHSTFSASVFSNRSSFTSIEGMLQIKFKEWVVHVATDDGLDDQPFRSQSIDTDWEDWVPRLSILEALQRQGLSAGAVYKKLCHLKALSNEQRKSLEPLAEDERRKVRTYVMGNDMRRNLRQASSIEDKLSIIGYVVSAARLCPGDYIQNIVFRSLALRLIKERNEEMRLSICVFLIHMSRGQFLDRAKKIVIQDITKLYIGHYSFPSFVRIYHERSRPKLHDLNRLFSRHNEISAQYFGAVPVKNVFALLFRKLGRKPGHSFIPLKSSQAPCCMRTDRKESYLALARARPDNIMPAGLALPFTLRGSSLTDYSFFKCDAPSQSFPDVDEMAPLRGP